MGGGNEQKSATARARNQAKAEKAKAGGGGSDGKAKREQPMALICTNCKQSFPATQVKGAVQHVESKHPKLDFATCFPGVEIPA